jgi:polysaccharide pyruvyl transferase WcaK-like protein
MNAIPFLTRPRRDLNVCLILHASRSNNLGVGALTVAQVDLLRGLAIELHLSLSIALLDWHDDGAPCVSGDDIERAELVLDIGAGDSFADIYGTKRMKRVLWLKYLTHLAGTPLVLAPQTYGPFTNPVSRGLARGSLNMSALVCARDKASVAHLRDIGLTRDVIVASDVALRMPKTETRLPPAKRPRVGLNVSGLMMSGGYHGANQFGLSVDYPALMDRMISTLLAHPEQPEVHLIPHVICPDMPVEDDVAAMRTLAEDHPGVQLAPAFKTPSEAKGYISEMSYMVGSRMHACIAALSTGVAVIPLAYSRKFSGLFGALGYGHGADCTVMSAEAIVEAVIDGFERRSVLANEAKAATQEGLARLAAYEDGLREIMDALGRVTGVPATQRATGQLTPA